MRCYLIRHGEILSNVKKVYAGTSQESLTEKGEEQVRALAERLKGRGIRILYASPLRRAVQTADILAGYLRVPVIIEKELKEIVLGPLEGLSYEQIKERFPEIWKRWTQAPAELKIEGMETLEEVQKRIVTLLKRWQQKHEDETFAAVTHLAVIRCLLLYTMERSLNDYRKIEIPNATAFVFEVNKKRNDNYLSLKLVEVVPGS